MITGTNGIDALTGTSTDEGLATGSDGLTGTSTSWAQTLPHPITAWALKIPTMPAKPTPSVPAIDTVWTTASVTVAAGQEVYFKSTMSSDYYIGASANGYVLKNTQNNKAISLTNAGTIYAISDALTSNAIAESLLHYDPNGARSQITNLASGSIISYNTAANGTAYGYYNSDSGSLFGSDFNNAGLVEAVSPDGNAIAVSCANSAALFVNSNTIIAWAGNDAMGVGLNGASFNNSGLIEVTGLTQGSQDLLVSVVGVANAGAFNNTGTIRVFGGGNRFCAGVTLERYDFAPFFNSGTITAISYGSQASVAVVLGENCSDYVNTGTIAGDYAFAATDCDLAERRNAATLTNSGIITGNIVPALSTIHNTGTITGDIAYAVGDSVYDGANGHLNGSIFLGNGHNTVTLGAEDGVIYGGGGADTITGGAGNDFFDITRGNNLIDGKGGTNTLALASSDMGYIVDLGAGTATGPGTTRFSNIQQVVGSTFNDTLIAGATAATLFAGSGSDTLIGGAGNDTLVAGPGGGDTITGGGGSDAFVYSAGDGPLVITDFGAGPDLLNIYGYASVSAIVQQGADTLIRLSGSDTILLKNVATSALTVSNVVYAAEIYSGPELPPSQPIFGGAAIELSYDLTVAAGETLVFSSSTTGDAALFATGKLWPGNGGPSVVINGTLKADFTGSLGGYTGIYYLGDCAYVGAKLENNGLITMSGGNACGVTAIKAFFGYMPALDNTATGRIEVTAGQAYGLQSYDRSAPINNAGVISVTATNTVNGTAWALELHNPGYIINNSGTLSAHSASGSISTAAVYAADSGFRLTNTGNILATSDIDGDSVAGIAIYWTNSDPTIIDNSGTITGHYAIREITGANGGAPVYVRNAGTLNGLVALNMNADWLVNSGTINGDVDLGDGFDIYDGRGGRIAGTVSGGAGDDFFYAGSRGDTLAGGDGNDTFIGGASGDVLSGGAGSDLIDFTNAGAAVTVDLAHGTATGAASGADTLSGIENVIGSSGNDVISGDYSANTLTGGAGGDTLYGGGGNDTLYGDWQDPFEVTSLAMVSTNVNGLPVQRLTASAYPIAHGYWAYGESFSADKTKMIFVSGADDLVTVPTGDFVQVFVKDLTTGSVTQLAFEPGDGKKTVDMYATPLLSRDGTKAAIGQYVMNLATSAVISVNKAADGTAGDGVSTTIVGFTPDGTKVLFLSDSSNLVAGDTNAVMDFFWKDLTTGAVSRVSTTGFDWDAYHSPTDPVLAPDGTKVLFQVYSGLYLEDLMTGAVTLVSVNADGSPAETAGGFSSYSISPDGTKVLFVGASVKLVPGIGLPTTYTVKEVYMRDLVTNVTTCLSTTKAGIVANEYSDAPVFSPDGKYVAFISGGTNLSEINKSYLFVRNLATGAVWNVSLPWGLAASGMSGCVQFSPDGTKLIIQGGSFEGIYVAKLAGNTAAGVNVLDGGAGDDRLFGGSEHDTLTGGSGNDTLDGGSNIDTAVFAGNAAAYTITQGATGVFTVSGSDGTDTLSNVEYAKFDDKTVRLLSGSGSTVNWAADPSTYMAGIRDFDGNDVGAVAGWKLIGTADVNGDGTVEHILVNRQNGRWAEISTEADGKSYFANSGWAGDTRVVGIYIDPLVASGEVVAGSDTDSQRRFQNDLNIENIHGVLGQADYNHDGLQEIYFALTDGTAYLHAYMHADGNIQYANYQNESQVKDYLTSNGFTSTAWAGWFPAAQTPLAGVAGG